jgi:2-aminoadipate transaminase
LRIGPKFIYCLPNFQNPGGTTLTLERRKKLVEMADHFGIPIIEDDPYGQLRFEGEHLPPVVRLDGQLRSNQDSCYRGDVIYLSTFSKILAPGLRMAWVIAPPEVIRKMVMAKQGCDLHSPTFNQFITFEVSRGGFLSQHVKKICAVYKERRDAMLDALEEFMPTGVHWTHPQGGLFLWVTLPEGMNTLKLFERAVKEKVAFVPGVPFHPRGGGENTMRLNFSYCAPEVICEGISRLGKVIRQAMNEPVPA